MEFPPKPAIACIGVILLGLGLSPAMNAYDQGQIRVANTTPDAHSPSTQDEPRGQTGKHGKEHQRQDSPRQGVTPTPANNQKVPTPAPPVTPNPDQANRSAPNPSAEPEADHASDQPDCLAPSIEFERISGKDRFATAIAVSKKLYEARAEPHVILASAATFSDAIAALNASEPGNATPILLTPAEGLTPELEAELRRIATKDAKVTLIGGPDVLSDNLLAQVETFGYAVERIAGIDRVNTAMRIADHYPKPSRYREYVISPAGDFATSLVAGALAVHVNAAHVTGHTDPNVPNPVYGWLHERNPFNVWVVGDGLSPELSNRSSHFIHADMPPAVNAGMSYPGSRCASDGEPLAPGPVQQTIAERILVTAFRDATDIVVVDADSPVDGIAAGQMAAQYNAPILPLYRDMRFIDRYVGLIKTLGAKDRMIHFVGGKRSISDEVQGHFIDYLSR